MLTDPVKPSSARLVSPGSANGPASTRRWRNIKTWCHLILNRYRRAYQTCFRFKPTSRAVVGWGFLSLRPLTSVSASLKGIMYERRVLRLSSQLLCRFYSRFFEFNKLFCFPLVMNFFDSTICFWCLQELCYAKQMRPYSVNLLKKLY